MTSKHLKAGTLLAAFIMLSFSAPAAAQRTPQPDWRAVEAETLQHFQNLLRIDSADPPGNERPVTEYLAQVFVNEGIPVEVFALEDHRPSIVARLAGSGAKRPLLLMGHQDVVNVDPAKWQFPPFSATRDGGYVYGRGAVDDKDNLTANLMMMLMLKRMNVPLDRDVIFLGESGEEGSTAIGIEFMVDRHFDKIDAEYCLAEGGSVTRLGGQVRYAGVQTVEKLPRAIELTARGISGHGSVPLKTNPVVHLAAAVAKIAAWQPPISVNETTATYFRRLANFSVPEEAARYRAVLNPGTPEAAAAVEWFRENDPRHAAILHSTISPNIIDAGYRINVIPSEAKAQLDTRMLPDDDYNAFLDMVREVIDDPAIEVAWAPRNLRPPGVARLDTEAFEILERNFKQHYSGAPVLPTMSTGATDMAYLRAKGIQCYGIGPGIDEEDGPKGYGAHSDQERILEDELHRFVRFEWDVVTQLAGGR